MLERVSLPERWWHQPDAEEAWAEGYEAGRAAVRELLDSEEFRAAWACASDAPDEQDVAAANRLYDLARDFGVDLWSHHV